MHVGIEKERFVSRMKVMSFEHSRVGKSVRLRAHLKVKDGVDLRSRLVENDEDLFWVG